MKRNTLIIILAAIIFAFVAFVLSPVYLSREACARHANTSQMCVVSGSFWKVVENGNFPPLVDGPLPKYVTVNECAQHANTAQRCIQDSADKLWYVISSNHP